jgi:uncharacterized protein YjdB/uncharacterized protein YfaP (DUF2135 family)
MKKWMTGAAKISLGFVLAFALFFSNIPVGSFAGQDVAEVQAASKIKLNKKKLSLYVKNKATLKLKGTKKKVKWSSSNKKVATVSKKGVVTAKKKGKATITAKVGKKKYKCQVTVSNPSISNTSLSLNAGATAKLTVKNAVGTVTWSSSNTGIATVTAAGEVKGIAKGTATITAVASGVKLTCAVTVKNIDVTGITVDKAKVSLLVGETASLRATVAPDNATIKDYTWASSNAAVATVDQKGLVKGVGPGKATITVTTKDQGKKANVEVTVIRAVEDMTISADKKTISIGDTFDLVPTILPADATEKGFKIESSDKSVAAVDDKGVVTGLKDGTTTITVKAVGKDITKTCEITVKTELQSVSFTEDKSVVDVGNTINLQYEIVPEKTTVASAVYESNDDAVATVSDSGVVKGIKSGTTQIKVTLKDKYGNEKEAIQTVTVIQHVESLNLNASTQTIYLEGAPFTINATVLPADANDKSLKFESSAPDVASVSEDGVVSAVSEGNAVITVSSNDQPSIKQTIEITVKDASATTAIVATQEELTEALNRQELLVLNIKSDESIDLTIPAGTYDQVSLIIDAPKGHIVNNAKFKDVTIRAISETTYVENSENTINYQAQSGTIEVGEDGTATINVLAGADKLNLVNNGHVAGLTITAPNTNTNISGNGGQLSMPVVVTSGAENTGITTSNDLNISADTKINLDIQSGGETTNVVVNTASSMPNVSGRGRISVTISDTGSLENVVAENDSTEPSSSEKYSISGTIKNSEGETVDRAKVYLIPYSSSITLNNIKIEDAVKTAESDNGAYSLADVPVGNYYLYINEEGYTAVLDTVILYNESHGQGKNYTLVKAEDADATGTIQGKLTDAETGNTVEEGLTVYLRAGLNNVSGEYLTYTTTDSSGEFTFVNVTLGQYTVQIIDQREDTEAYYVTNSYDVTVAREGVNSANGTLTKVIMGDQVRFVLTWGDYDSGASADLDSHLVGPTGNSVGQFHVYYGDETYSYRPESSEDGVRHADLDVDDTDYEGPETTTIYVKTAGTYSFYVYDYSNEGQGTNLRKSSAVVKAYIGSKLMATYNCPQEDGGLWYVCDYNSTTNKFVTKNIVSDFTEGSSNVGIDMVERYQGLLSEAIQNVESVLAKNPEYAELLTGTTITHAKEVLASSDDYKVLSEQYNYLKEFLDGMSENLYLDEVAMYDAEGNNLLSSWDTDYDDDNNHVLYVSGFSSELSNLTITVAEGSSVEITASDLPEYPKAVTVTNSYGVKRVYYVSYSQTSDLRIGSVKAYYTDDNGDKVDIVDDWETNTYYDDDDNSYRVLTVWLDSDQEFEEFIVSGRSDVVKSVISESDRDGYSKKVTLSYGDMSNVYYIKFVYYGALGINDVQANDGNGDSLIYDWWTDWYDEYDEENDDYIEFPVLVIKGYAAALPDNLEITPRYRSATVQFKDSDKEGYSKVVTVTFNGDSRDYYISYSQVEYE